VLEQLRKAWSSEKSRDLEFPGHPSRSRINIGNKDKFIAAAICVVTACVVVERGKIT